MNSFREITRALHLMEKYETICSEFRSSKKFNDPYSHLNFYTASIVSVYPISDVNDTKRVQLAEIASEFIEIYNSVEHSKNLAFNNGE